MTTPSPHNPAQVPPSPGDRHLRWFLAVLIAASVAMVALRCMTKIQLGYDCTLQIQEAQHLLHGQGLTVYVIDHNYFGDGKLVPFTHYPVGYSLYVATGLGLGLPLALVMSIYGAILIALGWWGWERLMVACMGRMITAGGAWLLLACFFAVVFVLFCTPFAGGTDIYLWTVTPWILRWLALAPGAGGKKQFMYDALIGLACGSACVIRYQGIGLAFFAGLVIFVQSMPNIVLLVKRALALALPALPFLAVQAYVFHLAGGNVNPGGINDDGMTVTWAKFTGAFQLLPTLNIVTFFWLPDSILRHLISTDVLPFVGWGLTLLAFLLPVAIHARARFSTCREALVDVRFLAALLLVFLPIFLFVCQVLATTEFVGITRYYAPLLPLGPLLIFSLAGSVFEPPTRFSRFAGPAALVYIGCFTIAALSFLGFLFVPGAHGNVARVKVLQGSDPATFPSCDLAYNDSPMRNYVAARLKADPSLLLITNFESLFYADDSLNQKRIHTVPGCAGVKGATITGPFRMLIVAIDDGHDLNYFQTVDTFGQTAPVPCLRDLPHLKLLKTFDETFYPAVKIKVLEASVPEGSSYHFPE